MPTVAPHDTFDGRQANAQPLEFASQVQALEGLEQLTGIGHIEARPVIADEERSFVVRRRGTNFDQGIIAMARELPGVADQVLERGATKTGSPLTVIPSAITACTTRAGSRRRSS